MSDEKKKIMRTYTCAYFSLNYIINKNVLEGNLWRTRTLAPATEELFVMESNNKMQQTSLWYRDFKSFIMFYNI